MHRMTLEKMADACGGALVLGTEKAVKGDFEISSAVLDSRKVEAGGLFIATVGERVDGHSFIGQVFEKGVACVLTQKTPEEVEKEHGISPGVWGAYILVESTLQALKDIAAYYRSVLEIPIVGITGSVGKTSTKEFVASVLEQKYCVLKTEGNYNNEIGLPLTVLRIRDHHEVAVLEMGISDFGEMSRLGAIARPNICVITNIGECHLEKLGDREGVFRAKTEIFDYLAPGAHVCLNAEDDKLANVKSVRGVEPYFFGLDKKADVYVTDVVSKGIWGSSACLHLRKPERELTATLTVPLPGRHMVLNGAAAACVGSLLGVSLEEIAEGIEQVRALKGRSNLLKLRDYTLIDDCYNANPVSMKAALDLLRMAEGHTVAVLGDMLELGEDKATLHGNVGAYAANSGISRLICIGPLSYYIYEAAIRMGCESPRCFYFASKEDFLHALKKDRSGILPEGSTVLLKASNSMGFSEITKYMESFL